MSLTEHFNSPPPIYKVGDRVEVWSTSNPRTDVGTIIKVWNRQGLKSDKNLINDEKDLYIIKLDAPLKSSLPSNTVMEIGRGPESLRREVGPLSTTVEDGE